MNFLNRTATLYAMPDNKPMVMVQALNNFENANEFKRHANFTVNNSVGQLEPYSTSNTSHNDYELKDENCHSFDISSNRTYWNITCDAPIEYVIPLYGYCMPFLLILTILSNSLIVVILSRKNMITPTNFVLMAMAICDMLTVIFPAPGLWYMYTFGNHYKPLHPVSMCIIFNIFHEILPNICHTASIWLTLALAVQRYIYVCHAPMARTWCTMARVKRCTLYIAIASILHQSVRFFDRIYHSLIIKWNGQLAEVCYTENSAWVEFIGEDLYYTSYYTFRVLFVHLLPCILLVTFNMLLYAAMHKAQKRRKLLFQESRKRECKKSLDSNCTTFMLIVVVTVFLIVEIPIATATVLHIVSSLIIPILDYDKANAFIAFTNFFVVVSYPLNFGIYCGMSRQFRKCFKELFLQHDLPTKENSSSRYSVVNSPRTLTNTNDSVL